MGYRKRGRPSTITLKIEKKEFSLADKQVKQIMRTEVRDFSRSGGYIPMSQEYKGHEAFVIILEKDEKQD